MPDIEAMELVERFFEIGTKVVRSPHPVASFSRAVASACPNGRFRSLAECERTAGAGTTILSGSPPTFAHVGKIARRHRAERWIVLFAGRVQCKNSAIASSTNKL
jgi:hypothetical protein